MYKFDFQAISRTTVKVSSSAASVLESRNARNGGISAFHRELQSVRKKDNGPSARDTESGTAVKEKYSDDGNRDTCVPDQPEKTAETGSDSTGVAAAGGQAPEKLEVKDENGSDKEIKGTQAGTEEPDKNQDDSVENDDPLIIIDMLRVISCELVEETVGLTNVINGNQNLDETGSDLGDLEQLLGQLGQDAQTITDSLEDLETIIASLSDQLKEEMGKAMAGTEGNEKGNKLSITVNGMEISLKTEGQSDKTGKSEGKGNPQSAEMLMVKLKEGLGASSGGAGEEESPTGDSEGNSNVKKLLVVETHRTSLTKLQLQWKGSEENSHPQGEISADAGFIPGRDWVMKLVGNDPASFLKTEATNGRQVEARDIIDQIVKKMDIISKPESSEISIQLKPDFLGKMTIKLSMEDGILSAKFVTDNHQVKNLLDQNLAMFKQQLEAAGIKVEKTEVYVQVGSGTDYGTMAGQGQANWQWGQQDGSGQNPAVIIAPGTEGLLTEESEEYDLFGPAGPYDDITGDSSVSYVI